MSEHERTSESRQDQRSFLDRIKSLEQQTEYNTKLLETIVERLSLSSNDKTQKVLDLQLKGLRAYMEKYNFPGKEELTSVLDSIGSKL